MNSTASSNGKENSHSSVNERFKAASQKHQKVSYKAMCFFVS